MLTHEIAIDADLCLSHLRNVIKSRLELKFSDERISMAMSCRAVFECNSIIRELYLFLCSTCIPDIGWLAFYLFFFWLITYITYLNIAIQSYEARMMFYAQISSGNSVANSCLLNSNVNKICMICNDVGRAIKCVISIQHIFFLLLIDIFFSSVPIIRNDNAQFTRRDKNFSHILRISFYSTYYMLKYILDIYSSMNKLCAMH